MADDRGTLRQIAWLDLFPWLSLARAVRVAAAPRLIFLSALGMIGTSGGWWIIGAIFSGSVDVELHGWSTRWPNFYLFEPLGDWLRRDIFDLNQLLLHNPIIWCAKNLSEPFVELFDPRASVTVFAFSLLRALVVLAVWALVGGAITRIAALTLTRESRLGLVGGVRFGIAKWPAYFFAALVPMSAVALLGVLGMIYGLLMRADILAFVMSLLFVVLLLVAFGVAVLLLGLCLGWPLMWPTVSTEGTDSFDALSRSYSYTFQRPLHYLFYVIVAGLLGLLATYVAMVLAYWTQHLGIWAISWGAGQERAAVLAGGGIGGDESPHWAVNVLAFWNNCISLLVVAYIFSYFWTAITRIYLLLRLQVDGTEMDEIAFDEQAESEQSYGLPPLATDESGIPRVVDPPPQAPPASGGADKPPEPRE